MSLIARALDAMRERRAVTRDPWSIPRPSDEYGSWAGMSVTERSTLQQMAVWSSVTLIGDTVSTLPVSEYLKEGKKRIPQPDPQILQQPHPEWDLQEWLFALQVSLLLRGNAYGLVTARDELGYATQVLPMHPDEVLPKRDENKRIVYKIGNGRTYKPFDILHIKGFTLPGWTNGLMGLNPIEYARQSIALGMAATEFGAKSFAEGIYPPLALTTEHELKQEVADALLARWKAKHGNMSREPAVLSGGIKIEKISITPADAQFLESRQFTRSEIAGFFRVPPHRIGDMTKSTSWGSGLEEENLAFIGFTCQPWIVRFERALARLRPPGTYVKFNVDATIRPRLLDRYRAHLMARQGGWNNVDEVREKEDQDPLPDGMGQQYQQPLNWGPLGIDPTKEEDGPAPGQREG